MSVAEFGLPYHGAARPYSASCAHECALALRLSS
jgi:hypothetical protein